VQISLERLFSKILKKCESKNSKNLLYFVSFIESIFFPIPTDIFLVPYILANRVKYIEIALITTIYSVLGGITAYYIGFFLWDYLSFFVQENLPTLIDEIENFKEDFNEYGSLLVVIGGFSPFPYKITSISSGLMEIGIFSFIIFSFISRGIRFFLISYFFYKFGENAKLLIKKYINIFSVLLVVLLILIILIKNN